MGPKVEDCGKEFQRGTLPLLSGFPLKLEMGRESDSGKMYGMGVLPWLLSFQLSF